MDQLPRELIDAILHQCVARGPKNSVLPLRLVCRLFDHILKPFICRTLGLEFSRLSKTSGVERPQIDALQTIGYHCKSLYVDLMVLRDDSEVEFLETVFARVPSMTDFCETLHRKYCMNETSFTEMDYYRTVEDVLFNCRDVDRLRLNLPFQLVGRHVNAATMILANTFKAFAQRPEEDSAQLKALVLENVTDIAICHLWMNPSDVMNIMRTLEVLEHLVMTLRRHENEPARVGLFGTCLWSLLENAVDLKSLCLIGMDHDDRPPRGLKQTKGWQMTVDEWKARSLPAPHVILANLTCLELRRVEVCPEVFIKAAENFGLPLEELYLNEVYLKAEQSRDWNTDSKNTLWIGLPNQRPGDDCQWVAMALRCAAPRLRICRASFLAYDLYLWEDTLGHPEFDLIDPCGLGRSVSQRFVEVVMGIQQPDMSSTGDSVKYLPRDSRNDSLIRDLKPRRYPPSVADYDTNAYQVAIANTTSEWHKSIDGIFPNINSNTLDELHYIAETACQGMNEIHRRRNEWTAGNSMANEFAENMFNLPMADED
ncbi:Fc.00g067910.m01.CDS01 [Cosmosporella sp. VM-42]